MRKGRVSTAVIRRLPRYYRHLCDLRAAGVERISSGALGEKMGLTASQIRQDLSCFGEFGQQGYGYHVETLLREVSDILGMNAGHRAVLLGVGNLGRALLKNFPFESHGVCLIGAFDTNPELFGCEVGGVKVLPIESIADFLAANTVHIGVLTLPGEAARRAALHLGEAGVRGLWNFTNTELNVPSGVVVEDVHFADSLLALSYMISAPGEGSGR